MSPLITVLRLIHILSGVYWAGTVFFFVTFLEPTIRSLGPDGGKVMIRLFERGYLKLLPIVAVVTVLSGLWMLWILSSGFDASYMRTTVGMSLSTGGSLAAPPTCAHRWAWVSVPAQHSRSSPSLSGSRS